MQHLFIYLFKFIYVYTKVSLRKRIFKMLRQQAFTHLVRQLDSKTSINFKKIDAFLDTPVGKDFAKKLNKVVYSDAKPMKDILHKIGF